MEIPSIEIALAALVMIKWRRPNYRTLVDYVLANDQGCEAGTICSERWVHEWTGLNRSLIFEYLNELVARRVLLRVDGGGPRGHAYRLNSRPAEWLVPWLEYRDLPVDRVPDRAWLMLQEVALNRIYRLIHPDTGHKRPAAARPVSALTTTVARADAPLSGPSRADDRAADGPLAARTDARQASNAARGTHISRSTSRDVDLSLPDQEGRERSDKLAATIADASGAPGVWGRFERELAVIVTAENLDRLLAKVRSAPRGQPIGSYIALCRQAASGSALGQTVVTTVRERCDKCGGTSGMLYNDAGEVERCPVCNPGVTGPCDDGDGGAP